MERSKNVLGSVPRKAFCNTYAWKICAAGFAADFIGSLFLFAAFMITSSHKPDSLQAISHGLGLNPFENAAAFLIVVVAILLAAYCIYRFDRYILKRASALFQADAAEELRVYLIFYKRKTTLKMTF